MFRNKIAFPHPTVHKTELNRSEKLISLENEFSKEIQFLIGFLQRHIYVHPLVQLIFGFNILMTSIFICCWVVSQTPPLKSWRGHWGPLLDGYGRIN